MYFIIPPGSSSQQPEKHINASTANMAFKDVLIDRVKIGIFLAFIFTALAGLTLLMWLTAKGKNDQMENG